MAYSVLIERVRVQLTVGEVSLRVFQYLLMEVHSNIGYSLCFRHILVE
jgi:hypothetical protein